MTEKKYINATPKSVPPLDLLLLRYWIEVKLKRHKLIWNTIQEFANSGVVRIVSGGIKSWAQVLGAHQHTLQSFKNTILSRNLDQNMLKNALFLKKDGKIFAAWYFLKGVLFVFCRLHSSCIIVCKPCMLLMLNWEPVKSGLGWYNHCISSIKVKVDDCSLHMKYFHTFITDHIVHHKALLKKRN